MPIHPDVASKFHLLEGISSFHRFVEDSAVADRRKAFDEHPGYNAPAVRTRMEEAPGSHGPVRIYTPDRAGNTPGLVWMHGGAFIAGDLDMPEADCVARELASRAETAVIRVDYRLCAGGVTYPVPHAAWPPELRSRPIRHRSLAADLRRCAGAGLRASAARA